VPRVAASPASFECRLTEIIHLKGANGERSEAGLTLGEVVAVHIDKAFIRDGVYETALARPIARAGRRGDYFDMTPETMFEMGAPATTFSIGLEAVNRLRQGGGTQTSLFPTRLGCAAPTRGKRF
jgi:hypothetical protein